MGQKNYYHNQYGGRPQFEVPQVETTTSAAKKAAQELLNYARKNPGKSVLIVFGGASVIGGIGYGLNKAFKYTIRCIKKKAPETAPAETPEKPAEAPAESAAEEGKK